MIGFRVRKVDTRAASAKAARANKRAVTMMTLAAIGDTRPYVPRVSGALVGTADTESRPERGLIVYGSPRVPYARDQYYLFPRKTTAFHPRATRHWFAASKRDNARKWEKVAAEEYRKEFGA